MNLPRVVTGRRRQLLARLVLNGFAQAAATVSTAWLVREAFHLAMTAGGAGFDPQRLAAIGAGLLASAAALAWLRTEERAGAERMGQHYAEELRLTLFDVLASVPVRALQRRTRGGLALRFTGDMKALRQWVSMGLARVTVGGVIIVLSLVALAAVSGALALTAALVIGAGTAAAVALGGRTRDAMREARRRNAYLAANVGEKIASIAVVQVFNQSRRERDRLERQSDRLNEAMVLQARRSAQLRGIADFTASIASAAVLVVGALETVRGELSPASVAAGMAMVGLLLPSLRDLGLAFGYWNGTQVSRRKLVEFMQSPTLRPEPEGAPDVVPGAGRIEFRDVMLEGSVSGFSAVAEGGNMVAIVGPNGSGKSSLLALAARLVDPDEGKILLDGQDLAACTLASVRKALGVVSADLPLLRGSLDMNLRYRWPKAPEYEMERVRALCEMDEMLRELPDGTKFRVQEGGANLSLGQRQRIALARALIGCPPVLLLDEADANLDGRSTAILDHVLEQFPGTVLIVTHRYERAAKADVIWYVENGRLVESGSPRQLLRGNGPTARLLRPALSAVG